MDVGDNIGDTVPISYQEVINRSAGDPMFRSTMFSDPEQTLSSYHYSMKEKQKKEAIDLIGRMHDVARSQLKSHLESIVRESV